MTNLDDLLIMHKCHVKQLKYEMKSRTCKKCIGDATKYLKMIKHTPLGFQHLKTDQRSDCGWPFHDSADINT